MTPKTVWAVYFSGTGTTERTVRSVAGELARMLSVPCRSIDFTRPQARQKELSFCERDLVVFGTPVYAGRVPNVLLPYLREKVRGGGALAVPVVLFGSLGGTLGMFCFHHKTKHWYFRYGFPLLLVVQLLLLGAGAYLLLR